VPAADPPAAAPAGRPARLVALAPGVSPPGLALVAVDVGLGRNLRQAVVVADPAVSRRHARVVREGGAYRLEDAGSTNGTFVNGERLAAPRALADGDRIGLGREAPHLRFVGPDPGDR
jgi:hypothetical protein